MLNPLKLEAWVQRLLQETRAASILLASLVKARHEIGPALAERLDDVHRPLLELIELQIHHRAVLRLIMPKFAAELREAYGAVHSMVTAIDHCKNREVDGMARDLHEIIRSLDTLAMVNASLR